jgi:hypothetical protein
MVFDLRESPFPRGSLHFSCHDHWAATTGVLFLSAAQEKNQKKATAG